VEKTYRYEKLKKGERDFEGDSMRQKKKWGSRDNRRGRRKTRVSSYQEIFKGKGKPAIDIFALRGK